VEILGLSIVSVGFFVGFGLLIGILFGFFGMGGSFLVTPALLVIGYPAPVAVGSGLAFVFGTSVIGALRHRDHGQVCYTLAAVMILGMTFGIEVGTRVVFLLADLGSADVVISVARIARTVSPVPGSSSRCCISPVNSSKFIVPPTGDTVGHLVNGERCGTQNASSGQCMTES
jgi:hypothetical protein